MAAATGSLVSPPRSMSRRAASQRPSASRRCAAATFATGPMTRQPNPATMSRREVAMRNESSTTSTRRPLSDGVLGSFMALGLEPGRSRARRHPRWMLRGAGRASALGGSDATRLRTRPDAAPRRLRDHRFGLAQRRSPRRAGGALLVAQGVGLQAEGHLAADAFARELQPHRAAGLVGDAAL